MIRIEQITIHEFRGIRNLTLEFSKKNFAICGPNGTGKSGVVDAIEFALTGTISRLSGKGTGNLSVKSHGPHVDSRDNPAKSSVNIVIQIPSIDEAVSITRNVKDPSKAIIYPDTEEIRTILSNVLLHPEFTLTRRELIKYVLAEPGDRAKEVQELLQLSELESLRTIFTSITNSTKRDVDALEKSKALAISRLLEALDITNLTQVDLLGAVNQRREILCLPKIETLDSNTSIKDGILSIHASSPITTISKHQAILDIKELHEKISRLISPESVSACQCIISDLVEMGKNSSILDAIAREKLLNSAIELFDGNKCPVCDSIWTHQEFIEHVRNKLRIIDEAKNNKEKIEKSLAITISEILQLVESLKKIVTYHEILKSKHDISTLTQYIHDMTTNAKTLTDISKYNDISLILNNISIFPQDILSVIKSIDAEIAAIPDATKQDQARDYLSVAQERLETYRQASRQYERAKKQRDNASLISNIYDEKRVQALSSIYKNVEEEFSSLYSIIHYDDEENFGANLKPSANKLGFDVDFYGRGFFPPGAYHSEGHQDGMGLCLYLALMNYLLGKNFTFAVLDDVLMSVDSGHRRAVSKLLQTKFPDTQFILTTHDEIWLRHMQTEGLIPQKSFTHFRTWNIDIGPTEWNGSEVWSDIDNYLKSNDVRSSAALLRHYLEYISKEICHNLRADVEFRGDAQYTLAPLLTSASSALKKLVKAGKVSAQSWSRQDTFAELSSLSDRLDIALAATNADKWQLNTGVHFNEWADLQPNDFQPVASAFHQLVDMFFCPDCGGLLRVTPEHGKREGVRCPCGRVNVNLLEKTR